MKDIDQRIKVTLGITGQWLYEFISKEPFDTSMLALFFPAGAGASKGSGVHRLKKTH